MSGAINRPLRARRGGGVVSGASQPFAQHTVDVSFHVHIRLASSIKNLSPSRHSAIGISSWQLWIGRLTASLDFTTEILRLRWLIAAEQFQLCFAHSVPPTKELGLKCRQLEWSLAARRFQLAYARHVQALVKAGFNPDQPRVPAGNPDGGQWTSGGGNGGLNDLRIISDETPDNNWKPGAQYAQNPPRGGRGPIVINGLLAKLPGLRSQRLGRRTRLANCGISIQIGARRQALAAPLKVISRQSKQKRERRKRGFPSSPALESVPARSRANPFRRVAQSATSPLLSEPRSIGLAPRPGAIRAAPEFPKRYTVILSQITNYPTHSIVPGKRKDYIRNA